MSPEDRDQHRRRIGFEVEVFLHAYWREDVEPMVSAGVLSWWMDELEDWSVDQVRWALRKWCRDQPGRRANVGHILGLLKQRRGEAYAGRVAAARAAAEVQAPPRRVVSEEERQRRAEVISSVMAGFARAGRS